MRYLIALVSLSCLLISARPVAAADASFKVGEFTFQTPAGWEAAKDLSPMRKAQFKVPGDGKAAGEVVFFHFGPGGGGGTQANISRWLGQFEEPKEKLNAKTEETKVKGRKITYVQAEGTYLSGMPGASKTPQPGTMLIGAIMESEEGDVFIRFTGPSAVGKASLASFRKMVEGGTPGSK